jgi:hypothetical protein
MAPHSPIGFFTNPDTQRPGTDIDQATDTGLRVRIDTEAWPLSTDSRRPSSRVTTIQNLGGGVVLVSPLYVTVDEDAYGFTASSPDLALAATGEDELDAIDDLRTQVASLYEDLSAMRDTLGPGLAEKLAFLDRLAS